MSRRISQTTLAVGSGKGGVGKSTVAVNLAVALAAEGREVGLLDADIYGPSIPIMMGLRRLSPRIEKDSSGTERVIPFSKFGVKVISIGFFMEEARSVTWRGPMLHGALQKMICDVQWGDLDFLIIDLPPGTGDALISLSQQLALDGAVVVTTPQTVAMLDAIKAINAFEQLDIPLTGVVENMAGFKPPGSDEVYALFGEGKAHELAQRFDTKVLGSIPFNPAIGVGGDEGLPIAFHESEDMAGEPLHNIAQTLLAQQRKRAAALLTCPST